MQKEAIARLEDYSSRRSWKVNTSSNGNLFYQVVKTNYSINEMEVNVAYDTFL